MKLEHIDLRKGFLISTKKEQLDIEQIILS